MKSPSEVIMVDDDHDDIDIMREAFGAIGREDLFRSFNSGRALLDYLDTQTGSLHSSVVLLDQNLPRETGEDILERLLAHPRREHLTLVSYSTLISTTQMGRLKEKGAVSCLKKPSSFQECVTIARQLCDTE